LVLHWEHIRGCLLKIGDKLFKVKTHFELDASSLEIAYGLAKEEDDYIQQAKLTWNRSIMDEKVPDLRIGFLILEKQTYITMFPAVTMKE